jgi:hypothetical protein
MVTKNIYTEPTKNHTEFCFYYDHTLGKMCCTFLLNGILKLCYAI